MVCEMGGKWPYKCYYVGWCYQDLFKRARSTLELLPANLFSKRFLSIYVVHPYSSKETAKAEKISALFCLKVKIDNLSIAVTNFARCMLTSFSVDEILLLRYVNWSTNFKSLPHEMKIALPCLKQVPRFICLHVETNASRCLLQPM